MSIVSIIGSGGMAAAIGGLAAKAGHTVGVMSRDAAKARALAEQVGAGATTVTFGAAPAGDIVVWRFPTQPFSTW
jgi:3-hydroxyisobutyrate dehydrogenase-like beta-hydroxyacid dehydrogenase